MKKLGKLKAQRDSRNFKMARLIKAKELPPIPEAWDYDLHSGLGIPIPVFANHDWGCCVIAGRAHQTLRFEATEQNKIILITDTDVLTEYWREQGEDEKTKPDNGLSVLASLKEWRKTGWKVGDDQYDIYAFAQVSRTKLEEVKAAAYLLSGLYIGLLLPETAEVEFDSHRPWMETTKAPGGWGGHCVYVCGYSSIGPTCITWGWKQLMTWDFFQKYCDEAYAVVDNRDRFLEKSSVDIEKLDEYLRKVRE